MARGYLTVAQCACTPCGSSLDRVSLFHAVEDHETHLGQMLSGEHESVVGSIKMEALERVGILGKGSFGLVTMVHHEASNRYMALKAMVKEDLVETGQVENLLEERNSCYLCRHEFIVRLYSTMQDVDQVARPPEQHST